MNFVITHHPITVTRLREHPTVYFIFGDNLAKRGRGGQAVIRYEPNAVGVPTKKFPSMNPGAFFTDSEYAHNVKAIDQALKDIPEGARVVVPDGIGRGMARMLDKAPRTYEYLCQRLGICI